MKNHAALALGLSLMTALTLPALANRQEFRFKGNTYSNFAQVSPNEEIMIGNDYGPVEVVIVSTKANKIDFEGTYQSASANWAGVQVVPRKKYLSVFIDGPAKFKSHDHTPSYGKPLDRAFFEANVGKIPGIERGEEEGDIRVGEVYVIHQRGITMGPRSVFWGPQTWGSEISMDYGACIGREDAESSLKVIVPAHLAHKISISSEVRGAKGSVVVTDQTGLFTETRENRDDGEVSVKLTRAAGCAGETAAQ